MNKYGFESHTSLIITIRYTWILSFCSLNRKNWGKACKNVLIIDFFHYVYVGKKYTNTFVPYKLACECMKKESSVNMQNENLVS